MKSGARRRRLNITRRAVQAAFLALFVLLAVEAAYPPLRLPASNFLLRLDPLAAVVSIFTVHRLSVIAQFWPALVLLGLTALSGRFFCAWICPLGTCFDAAGAVKPKALRYYQPRGAEIRELRAAGGQSGGRLRRWPKYVFLAVVIGLAIGGVNLLYIGSPMVVANRAVYQLLLPAVPFLFIGLVLVAFLYRPRFWCDDLCPTGALMSLVSAAGKRLPARVSPLAVVKEPAACISCGACFKRCDFEVAEPLVSQRVGRLASVDCTQCGECVEACPAGGALALESFGLKLAASGKKGARPVEGRLRPVADGAEGAGGKFVIGRREFIESAGVGAVLLAGYGVGLRKTAAPVLRMPGAQDEQAFIARCNRCEACARACPPGCLKPMGLDSGLQKLWTPRFVPRQAGCVFDQCGQACQSVCPTHAIERVEPGQVRIGRAQVNKRTCLAWRGNPCLVCYERCRFNAISLDRERPVVQADKCTGCGACEETCPTGKASIKVLPLSASARNDSGGGSRGRRNKV